MSHSRLERDADEGAGQVTVGTTGGCVGGWTKEEATGTQREGQRQRTLWMGEGLMGLGERSVKDRLKVLALEP